MVKETMLKLGLACAMTSLALGTTAWNVSAGDEKIWINSEHFPDNAFRRYILNEVDQDKDGFLDEKEIGQAVKFELEEMDIQSLKGIEYFTSLTLLDVRANGLEELDVSSNTKLKELDCFDNMLVSLNLGELPYLETLYGYSNCLQSVDLSGCPNLVEFSFDYNEISEIDVSSNTKLDAIQMSNNPLTKLDVSNCPELTFISVDNTLITSLDLSHNTKLDTLYCESCKIKSLDVSNNPHLASIICEDNPIKSLDVSNLPELFLLCCGNTKISSIDVSNSPKLSILYVDGLHLKDIDLSKNTELVTFVFDDNDFTSLDLTHCHELFIVSGENGKLESLDVSGTPITELYCQNNAISDLGVKGCTDLNILLCNDNKIEELDLTGMTKLYQLSCENNDLEKLDIRKCDILLDLVKTVKRKSEGNAYIYSKREYDDEYREYYTELFVKYDKKTDLVSGEPEVSPTPTATPTTTPTPTSTPTPVPSVTPAPGENGSGFDEFVERLYTIALGRASEQDGKAYWVRRVVDEGASGADCVRFFLLEAPEFMERNLSTEDFVEILYKALFDRESDAAGKKGWVDAITNNTMTRETVVNHFIESTEWCNVCASYGVSSGAQFHKATMPSKNASAFAARLYTCCLGREAEEGGLKYWALALTNHEKTGAEAAGFFFRSDEFVNLKTDDKEYVERLYATFMGRTPSEEEVNYWLGEISANRQTRSSVLSFFGQCEEFSKICKSYGIIRGVV